ncbi:cobyrinic acid a,c-diamide synthase [Novosphingobium capsulatum]|uniref:Cobyrinate a,c-diamide synthase n=1 Tax=Novosphingobium capsulatum TaxID=13688 RepID=A0ABU1MG46_9SPHN|nr:cobyrinate a,c-diamide synthase [Novosphingobium capsulatum]MDR6509179.1 cobyrinic acid a,c-diamide synthase [Novosphingobium capsulatum]
MSVPGLMIAAPSSGAGKTTLMLGLLRALHGQGLAVQPFKNGPDYIDPAFHQAACARASFNLDSWAMAPGLIDALAGQAGGADLALAEGSMGLFDGVASVGATGNGASADVARRLGWPVILVLDASGQAQSAAATALGFARFDPALPVAGVILNKVASPRHESLLRAGMAAIGMPVLGALPRRADLALPERHLGLVQAVEHPDLPARLDDLAAFVRDHVDLAALVAAARAMDTPHAASVVLPPPPAQRLAVACDAAFSFLYPHLLHGWRAAGAQILPFSPLADEAPPADADMVWLPGGYPELHAGAIAAAGTFLAGLRRHAQTRPVHGECGGYMVLGQGLVDKAGARHAMAGLLALETSHAQRRLHLGYRAARLLAPVGNMAAGTALRGHEFHYCTILAQGDAPLATVTDATGAAVAESGSRRGQVTGTFFHMIAGAA